MALADITLNDGQSTPAAHTFEFVTFDKQGRVIRKDVGRTPDLPLLLTLGHQVQRGANGKPVEAHVVKFDDARLDADGVTVRTAGVTITFRVDPNIYSDELADDHAALCRNLLTSTFVRALMRGSVG